MRWEERLLDVFDDLEQQAEGLALAERDAEVAELGRAEYAEIDLASRLHGSVGAEVQLDVTGLGSVRGRLARAGAGWALVAGPQQEWLIRFAAVASARGLLDRALSEPARGLGARLGIGSALRGIAEEAERVAAVRLDGTPCSGRVWRVGADFVELAELAEPAATGRVELVAFDHLAAVRRT